jgi:tRNA(Leu) C34 or U34 (ribose-2'-O)-methylase TrmL
LTAAQWKGVVQRFHLARWQAVRHLLSVVPSSIRVRLAPTMLEQCVDALDGSTEHFVEEVFHSVRLLMGPYVTAALQQSNTPQAQASVLSTLDRVYRSSWSAFKDLQGDLPSFEAVLAFLGVVFEATATNAALLPGNHVAAKEASERGVAQGPFRRILATLLDYGLHHARFLLYVSFFCSDMWLQQPALLTGYVDEVLMLCLFRASADAELDLVEEKVRAFELAHMIHAFSETTRAVGAGEGAAAAAVAAAPGASASASASGASSSTPSTSSSSSAAAAIAALGASSTASAKEVVKSDGLHRAESLVRCVALHMLQMLPSVLATLPDNEDGNQTRESMEVFLLAFARACTSHPSMQSEKGAMLGEGNDEFVRKLYLWQTLCIVVPSVRAMKADSARRREMHDHLASHAWAWFDRALTTVLRQQLELFLVQLYAAAPPQRVATELAPRIEQYLPRPTLLASVLVVLAFSTLSLLPASSSSTATDASLQKKAAAVDPRVVEQQARRTLRLLHPFVGSNFGHVRLVVQYLYHRIVTEMLPAEEGAGAAGQQDLAGSSVSATTIAAEDLSLQASLMRFLNSDPDLVRLRDRQRNYFAMFSPLACGATVQSLLAFGDEAHHFVQVAALDAITGVQGAFLTSRRDHYDDRVFPAPNTVSVGGVQVPLAAAAANSAGAAATTTDLATSAKPTASSAGRGANFQQKIELAPLTQLAAMGDITQQSPTSISSSGAGTAEETDDSDDASGDSTGGGGGVRLRSAVEQRSSAARQSVIVVASFVSKLPNLAGLARTCEIFQSARLMLSDPAAALSNPDFTAVAVTAHRWLPIEKLVPEDVGAFMAARQAEGYTCVALEQSAQSISLPRYQMPRKLVIILGAEKEGVPVHILNAVDQCVEIPQLGIIRSLNVHVSASILLWEHRRQAILGLLAEE